ncbi:hypothetical protein N665_0522s0014 [Sinapis alba]|nr:hypothetical protein N665_0522s0014 [Sinapis alba]
MDTPQKTVTQIETPVSKLKVENSPVFNYINSLSPITTIKSISTAQTFSSLTFNSPPPVFATPHVASHKGSRFRSHSNSSDPSKVGPASTLEEEEALIAKEPPQILKNECLPTTTPRVTNDGSCEEDGETDLQKMCDDNVKRKSDTPDWETLISDSSDMLIYGSPNDSEAFRCFLQRSSDSKTRLCGAGGSKPALVVEPVSQSNEPESSDALSILHRGVRRRCLDFEMPRNNNEQTPRCVVVPSIGLHLNAIAMSSKDNNSYTGNVKVGLQSSTAPVLPSHDIVRENETREAAAGGEGVEEAPMSLALVEVNQSSSPKKKRRKSEQAGEGESSCKRCNCKKSKCLKLYCECFAAGVYCIEPCSCVDCFNKPIHEDTVLATRKQIESRNPLAFAPKVIRNSESIIEDASKTPASARHKRGCNCKKSNCLKKYCECYQSGVGCSINCRCEGCKNPFGRKDGSSFAGMDTEQDQENETSGKSRTTIPLPPSTPMSLRQPLAQLPISSNNMLLSQQSQQHLHGASGSSLYNNSQSFRKQDMRLLSHSRIETIAEERAEDIENLIQSPVTNINAVSPNSKRVSLPHMDSSTETTPWRRNGGRKLLLSSIPTFPSLTPHH